MNAKNTLSTPHAFVIVALGILLLACAVPVARSRMIHLSVTAPGVTGEIRAEPLLSALIPGEEATRR